MTEQKVSSRYARAVIEIAKETSITDKVIEDFSYIESAIKQSRELYNLIQSPVVAVWQKKSILKEIFEDKVNKLTLNFVLLLVDKRRETLISSIIEQFRNINNSDHNRVKAEITSATELTEGLREKLLEKLSEMTGKSIIPDYKTDPAVKGGVSIRVGDLVYDATLKTQLEQLKESLSKSL